MKNIISYINMIKSTNVTVRIITLPLLTILAPMNNLYTHKYAA